MIYISYHTMTRFPKIPSGRDLWRWPPLAISLAVLAIVVASRAVRIAGKARVIVSERRAQETRILGLKTENAKIESALGRLASPEVVGRLAKEWLNLKNPGETVVVVKPDQQMTSASIDDGAPLRFWRKLSQFWIFLKR